MRSEALPHVTTVLGHVRLNSETFELICSRPEGFQFVAGQHVTLSYGGEEREYTILSPPKTPELRFLIKRVAGGALSNALGELAPGVLLGISKAKGYLIYRPTDRPVYFVATGVGIAPFVAMAAAGVTGFTLIHGTREVSGLLYRRELTLAANRYIPCLSGAIRPGTALLDLHRGYVTDYVDRHIKPGLYDFYLCGARAMIHDMTHILDQHYPGTRIYSEAYS
ncbi:ferredoxin--NADP reductase [Desulfobulbus sp.]|uniref:ferredoxin--NADP reductase n=1 Tax=Desulfobulbus sp. TaxID=895 RepID=UPI0027BAA6DC|nr:FAD-binding oxidoreductase [Desulfobulbus sp.]